MYKKGEEEKNLVTGHGEKGWGGGGEKQAGKTCREREIALTYLLGYWPFL